MNRCTMWRDVDSESREFGWVASWNYGYLSVTVHLGLRCYRASILLKRAKPVANPGPAHDFDPELYAALWSPGGRLEEWHDGSWKSPAPVSFGYRKNEP